MSKFQTWLRSWWAHIFFLLAVATMFASVVAPSVWIDHHPERERIAKMISDQDAARRSIAGRLMAKENIVETERMRDFGSYWRSIGASGAVLLHEKATGIRVFLVPKMEGDNVEWSCSSDQPLRVPIACREYMTPEQQLAVGLRN